MIYIWSAQDAAGNTKCQTPTALVFVVTFLRRLLVVTRTTMQTHGITACRSEAQIQGSVVVAVRLTMALIYHLRKRSTARGSVNYSNKNKVPSRSCKYTTYGRGLASIEVALMYSL